MYPKVLLCDEITSALDPELVGEVLKVIAELAEEGLTIVLVTHEMAFARDVADRVVFMYQGKIHEEGPAKEIFAHPKTPELTQFISRVPLTLTRRGAPDITKEGRIMFDISRYDQINPPARLLMGPGPINADPRVLRAMSAQLVGQYDPVMTGYMNETMALYREVFQTKNEQTFLVDGTSRAGIESVLVSAIRPGDPVLVTVAGRFGLLLCEIARRCGAELHVIEKPWGEVFTPEEVEEAIRKIRPRMLLTVHGDTSTTIAQPLEGLGEICHRYGVLFYTDATATLGGNTLKTDDWGLDAVTAGLQKCMAGSAGTSPVTLSPAFVDACRRRQHVEEGVRDAHHVTGPDPVIGSNYFDICMLMDYWGPERLNHHTEATTALYGARECARILCQEGVDRAVARHRLNGDAMLAGITAMGLKPFGDIRHKMNNVLGVIIPEGIDGEKVRAMLLADFGIEIGSSFGPLKGRIWRIGTMGYNARRDCVLLTLAALEAVLTRLGMKLPHGAALSAAWDWYDSHEQAPRP